MRQPQPEIAIICKILAGFRCRTLEDLAMDNPPANDLGNGVTMESLLKAARRSGFPLQSLVRREIEETLRKDWPYSIQEEWSYLDADTNEPRTLDIAVTQYLSTLDNPQPDVTPQLRLLVECKQSELPYVFFLSDASPMLDFPRISGLKQDHIELKTNGDNS